MYVCMEIALEVFVVTIGSLNLLVQVSLETRKGSCKKLKRKNREMVDSAGLV